MPKEKLSSSKQFVQQAAYIKYGGFFNRNKASNVQAGKSFIPNDVHSGRY